MELMLADNRTRNRFHSIALLLSFSLALLASSGTANTQKPVDLLLLFALDVSSSVDSNEYLLQRDGLANAIQSPKVLKAIKGGTHGRISVSVFQWSGYSDQFLDIDWTILESERDIAAFSQAVGNIQRQFSRNLTHITGAVVYSKQRLLSAPFYAERMVVDISGDGRNNVNLQPLYQRDLAVAAGITINGLVIMNVDPFLDRYYRDTVIGGAGAFVEKVSDFDDYQAAMERKLLREIGGPLLF